MSLAIIWDFLKSSLASTDDKYEALVLVNKAVKQKSIIIFCMLTLFLVVGINIYLANFLVWVTIARL